MYRHGTIKNKKGGFTLVELVTVMALLSILLSLGAGMMERYGHKARFQKNCEYAGTLYLASQAALTHRKAGGTLTDFVRKVRQSGVSVAEGVSETDAELYALEFTGKDYQALMCGNLDGDGRLLYDFLSDYVYDDSVWNAAVRVELDPEQALVYSVFYIDGDAYFAEEENPSGGAISVAEKNRSYEKCYELGLGYRFRDEKKSAGGII